MSDEHEHEACCGSFDLPLPAVDDAEGERIDPGLPPVTDAHVHLFPDGFFEAIWRWFGAYGWPIRYRLKTPEAIAFLRARGVSRIVALAYSHKPGVSRLLNDYMAAVARENPDVTGLATVHPGEPDAAAVLADAFRAGLAGVKLHCHVQTFSPDDERLEAIYATCEAFDRPIVMHAGREPKSPAYPVDTHALCAVERVERVLVNHPRLRLCVPHFGADEIPGYGRLLERFPNIVLDSTMMLADYFPVRGVERLFAIDPARLLYGTDFPNLPYAWDRELVRVRRYVREEAQLAAFLGGNAQRFFGIRGS